MNSLTFVEKFKKKLVSGADFYNPDTTLMKKEDFEKSKCKILVVFPTPHSIKTVSSTAAALNDFVIEHCPDTFIDFAYMPESSDISLYDQNNMPYALGNITHLDPSHFDLVGFSISVLSDVIGTAVMVKSFERCDKPIPLFWSDRKNLPLGSCPIIYAGGITAACSDVLFGKVNNNQAFLDFLYLGSCDKTNFISNRLIEAISTGVVTRNQEDHDVPGYSHIEIPDFQSEVHVHTIQDFIESLFDFQCIYQPQAYEVTFNKSRQITSNIKINPKAQDFVTPYYPHELLPDLGIARTIINANGDGAGTAQSQVSEGCSASGCCSFCAEGNYCGGWVEKSKEQILKEVKECKKYSAGYKYKPYSFNANYITDYKGMLREFIKIYPKVTFINMRMEELGRDIDAIKMMKLIGSNRISAPIEGLSPRIQNNLLNKCLSEEALTNFMDDMVHAKMADIKVGGIFTGYEEEQDFQWICDFVDSFKQRAEAEGGNFPFRLKVTPLVHYPLTPIEYLERKASKKSFNGEHWLTDEWYEKFREHEVYFKVNGFRYSTFIEQSIVDLGRALTPLIYKHFVQDCKAIYSLRNIATNEFVEDLKGFIDPETHFADRDPEHYISPCHRIHIELMGSYIPRARRLLRAKRSGDIFSNEPDIRCLKTYDEAKTMCQRNCIKNDPMKIYNDVRLNSNGDLEGDFRLLFGCERCETPELRKARLLRPTPQTATSDDIIATPRKPQVQKIRFVLNRQKDFDLLNPNNTAHTFITKFLQKSETLLESYHSIVNHNLFWQSEPIFKYYCSGIQIVDTLWSTTTAFKEIKALVDEVNSELTSVKIESVQEILRDDKLNITDINLFYFECDNIPQEYFQSAVINYKGEVKADVGSGTTSQIGTITDSTLKVPIFTTKGGKVCGVFAIPAKYSPVNYMSGFISTVKKMGIDQVATNFTFESLMCVKETSSVCKNCSKEKAISSIASGKQMPFGINCLCKAVLTTKLK